MALPKLESFTNTDGTDLEVHDANWQSENGTLEINTNRCYSLTNTSDRTIYSWQGDTFADNQYVQGVLTDDNSNGSVYSGINLRVVGTTGYCIVINTGTDLSLFQEFSSAASAGHVTKSTFTHTTGNTIRIEADGTSLSALVNGSSTGAPTGFTDATYASGAAGIHMRRSDTEMTVDDWEGGDLSAPPASTFQPAWAMNSNVVIQ